jgi:ABC-type Na+ efflux pump permease subunit
MNAIENESTKLSANYVNGVAIAIFAIGFFAPMLSFLREGWGAQNIFSNLLSVVCLLGSVTLHFVGRKVLKRLKP